MNYLYDGACDSCNETIALAANDENPLFKGVLTGFEAAVKQLLKNMEYKADDILQYKELIDATNNVFKDALSKGIKDNVIPGAMRKALENDTFLFSALKTHAQLLEASRLLLDEDGKVKSFQKFSNDVSKIKAEYNQTYLEAEYQFATTSAQMAAKWADVEENEDRYNIQYRTAGDDRVRDTHAVLNKITLKASDPFWKEFYPPNGWRCRCTAVEVLNDKYEQSDSTEAAKKGNKATSELDKDGNNRLAIFRFNPGQQKVIFPPKHPYFKLQGKAIIQESMKELLKKTEIKTLEDLTSAISDFAVKNKEYFARGFQKIQVTKKRNVNGSTDMDGNIWLTKERMDDVKDGLNAMRKGLKTTFKQEDAISTFHHEVWHNANVHGFLKMTKIQTLNMELANEFVSRKTLPDFMKKLGGELHNKSLIQDRTSTGYNRMVKNYDVLIKWTNSKNSKVLDDVKKHLINEKYTDQMQGLVNAIVDNSEFKMKPADIKQLISIGQKGLSVEEYSEILKRYDKLLVK